MKKLIVACIILSSFYIINAKDKAPKIHKLKNSIYYAPFENKMNMTYIVDSLCQICYIKFNASGSGEGVTTIPCSKLKRRPEWKSIITWE